MTPRVLIAGYYGAGNAGDEWILCGLLTSLRRRAAAVEARVLSYNPEETRRQHGVEALRWGDLEALAEAVRWSSLVIVGGGGLWQDYWGFDVRGFLIGRPDVLAMYGTPIIIAHLLGRPCALLGAGVGPLRGEPSRKAMRDLVSMAGCVWVRDTHSRQELISCGVDPARVHLGADLSFLAESAPREEVSQSGTRTLGVNLRPWKLGGAGGTWEDAIAASLATWCARTPEGRVVLVPLHESNQPLEDDRALSERFVQAIGLPGRVDLAPPGLPWVNRLARLANCDLVLGMRYHAIVAALRANVPCVGLAYDPKVRSIMGEAGATERSCELTGVDAQAVLARLVALRPQSAPQAIDSLRIRAEMSVEHALELEGTGAIPVPSILGDFVLGQSAYVASLVQTIMNSSPPLNTEGQGASLMPLPLAEAPVRVQLIARQREEALAQAVDLRASLARAEIAEAASRSRVDELGKRLADEKARTAEASNQLAALRSTAGVRLLDRYWRAMGRLAPQGSRRRRLYRMLADGLRRRARPVSKSPADRPDTVFSAIGQRWPADRRESLPGDEEWLQSLEAYVLGEGAVVSQGVVLLLAGTKYEGSEGQRSYHLARVFAGLDWKVVFGYWRWEVDLDRPRSAHQGGVFEIPLDVLLANPDRIPVTPWQSPGILLLEFPLPSAMRLLATANSKGYMTVYDAVDDWQGFHASGQAPWYEAGCEASIGGECDAILAASLELVQLVGKRCGRKAHLNQNGWAPHGEPTIDQAQVERGSLTLGYFGHLTEAWFDWELLLESAALCPEWRIHLIGYGGGWRTSQLAGNVFYHGKLPRERLPSHASQWDVGIIPFRRGAIALAADPIKTYEYLSLGLPVVATGVRAPLGAENLVHLAHDVPSFIRAVEEAAATAADRSAERSAFLAASTWEKRVEAIQQLIGSDEPRMVSKRALFGARP